MIYQGEEVKYADPRWNGKTWVLRTDDFGATLSIKSKRPIKVRTVRRHLQGSGLHFKSLKPGEMDREIIDNQVVDVHCWEAVLREPVPAPDYCTAEITL